MKIEANIQRRHQDYMNHMMNIPNGVSHMHVREVSEASEIESLRREHEKLRCQCQYLSRALESSNPHPLPPVVDYHPYTVYHTGLGYNASMGSMGGSAHFNPQMPMEYVPNVPVYQGVGPMDVGSNMCREDDIF
eukprot:266588_1